MPTFHLPLPAWKRRKKKLPTYPSLTGTAVEERLNCLTILYFHFPHLTSSSAILIFSMCTRRRFDILPGIWSPIIPESRSPISSCHFASKEGQDPWFIHFHHAARLKLWKSCFLNIISRTFNWSQINNLNFRYRLQNCRFFFFAKIRTVLQSSLLVILFYQGVKRHFKIDLIFFSN